MLAAQLPACKIADVIKSVLKCFDPSLNPEEISLPKKSCAGYMRKEELKTITDAHKSYALCDAASNKKVFFLNTDGTTKNQRKLGGALVNGLVLRVNELCDGTATTAIEDISMQFENLRHVAEQLGLPNARSINWSLIKASTSDSASTQKCFNRLIKEKRDNDELMFGPTVCSAEMVHLIETFCAMHLGINLRKAFLSGTSEQCERYHSVDTLVHEFYKLFGMTGVPEYACGVISFPDFLELKANDIDLQSAKNAERAYYLKCLQVKLHRQIGSRYFVTASNACKIIFLKQAAIEFLEFTGKN